VKFVLIDRISEVEPHKRIVAHKALSLAEEYLADHFPRFPVLPGVLMLEALVQASAWLVRASLDFRPGLVLLKEARNVTYKSFVAPGQVLTIESVLKELGPDQSQFTARGHMNGREIVKGQLTLRHLSLSALEAGSGTAEEGLRSRLRALYELLLVKAPGGAALGGIDNGLNQAAPPGGRSSGG
jgi:3-hydroxyacyl-[acyl-carrier-protein] dehydratase